jgi:hypothetical protein
LGGKGVHREADQLDQVKQCCVESWCCRGRQRGGAISLLTLAHSAHASRSRVTCTPRHGERCRAHGTIRVPEEAKLAAFGDMLRSSKNVQALDDAGGLVESMQHLKDLGDADSLDSLAVFAARHNLMTSIAPLSREAKLAAFGDMLRASKKVPALDNAGGLVESIQHLKDLGDADSLDRLAAFAARHNLLASIAPLPKEAKLAAFGDMLRSSKKVQALKEAGGLVESMQHLKDLAGLAGEQDSLDRLGVFATRHNLLPSIAPLSKEAKLAAFGNMLAASKQLKVLEVRGERVRDVQHLTDLAKPAQSAGGQSGSARQTKKITSKGIWDEYVSAIGKDPLAPTSPTNPLLVNLQDVIGQDDIEAFGDSVVVQLDKLTSWRHKSFTALQIEGHASAGKIRESISSHVSEDLGPARLLRTLRRLRGWARLFTRA